MQLSMLRPTLPKSGYTGTKSNGCQLLIKSSQKDGGLLGDFTHTNHAVGVNQIPNYWGTVFSQPPPPPLQYNTHQLPNRGGRWDKHCWRIIVVHHSA